MENLSNEELIVIATDYDGTLTRNHIQARKELLSRLESGDKAKQMCKEIVELYDKHFEA